ncbi:hypothetical protein jhhlp_004763 [Lomentospora prolificans]|uniref:Methyltransferase type 11 domain-containing protein n=1 Tax=Lomentospora prolificans TaxID=41688 RepID=A0A2N3N8C6_9PEZI|nr:hypothetical protein jhhlp_004763 [Lomentospora prolificans]
MSRLLELYSLVGNDTTKLRAIYDEWAASYDMELADASQEYVAPALAGAYLLQALGTPSINDGLEILDAGCGTGLVGSHLAVIGAKKIDGVDLSMGMLQVAEKTGAYRSLTTMDLSQTLPLKDQSYDAITCIGTLTQGHVGPSVLHEFTRVTKKGGFIVVTILDAIFSSGGYEETIKHLVTSGRLQIVSAQLEDYRRGQGVRAWMIVLKAI